MEKAETEESGASKTNPISPDPGENTDDPGENTPDPGENTDLRDFTAADLGRQWSRGGTGGI